MRVGQRASAAVQVYSLMLPSEALAGRVGIAEIQSEVAAMLHCIRRVVLNLKCLDCGTNPYDGTKAVTTRPVSRQLCYQALSMNCKLPQNSLYQSSLIKGALQSSL